MTKEQFLFYFSSGQDSPPQHDGLNLGNFILFYFILFFRQAKIAHHNTLASTAQAHAQLSLSDMKKV
jgi:hypothetical protein